jgi:hypothetical protein
MRPIGVERTINTAVTHLRLRENLSTAGEARLRGWLEKELADFLRRSKTPDTGQETVPDPNILYKMVAPGRFAPVPKKPMAPSKMSDLFSGAERFFGLLKTFHWKKFLAGLVCGLAIGSGLFYILAHRYHVEHYGPQGAFLLRTDSWTGKSWHSRLGEPWQQIQEPLR